MTDTLVQYEWIERPSSGVRFKFRRDGTGYYEREGDPGTRLVRDNLLHKLDGDRLLLKFAHAREWTSVGMSLQSQPVAADGRVGLWRLVLERDPYAALFEERMTDALVLLSDSGAALMG